MSDAKGSARQSLAAKRLGDDPSGPLPPLLTADEIEQLVRHLVARHGLRKVRLTGGDPTARPNLLAIIRRLSSRHAGTGLSDLAMTTHGLTLSGLARPCAEAGLRRVNVSLDSLDRETFRRITGTDGLDRVLAGIDAALSAGLTPVRINTVVMAGINDHQLPALVRWAATLSPLPLGEGPGVRAASPPPLGKGPRARAASLLPLGEGPGAKVEIRFIELMPMGPQAAQWATRYVPAPRMRQLLADTVVDWQPLPGEVNETERHAPTPMPSSEFPLPHSGSHSDSARRFRATLRDGSSAIVGFISPMDCPFCAACDRLRIGCDGGIHPCLMDRPAGSILPALRPRFDPERLDALLTDALAGKAPLHPAAGPGLMTHIGG